MVNINAAEYLRRELMIRFVQAFDADKLPELDKLPILMRPRDGASSRCCVWHDRAVLKYRIMALLGYAEDEEEDEARTLADYAQEAVGREKPLESPPLSVCTAGCSGCPEARYIVTGNCRGCFARPCVYNCPRQAISVVNQTSQIDYSKCIKCGKCLKVCPFQAIVKTTVPCEDACPVGAISKNNDGRAEIDFSRCIFCGKCFNACPFSAVMERSQLLDVLRSLRDGRQKIVALVAPSATAQFPGTLEQLFSAIAALGFADVIEVALGAEATTANEAREFIERMHASQHLMTTSCCPSWVELARKHFPQYLDLVSTTPSPMIYAAEIARQKYPESSLVFLGPCIAKRYEAEQSGKVDYVLTFEELGAMLAARKIDCIAQPPWPLPRPAAATARNFAQSCGVTTAVLDDLTRNDPGFKLDGKFINGIDRKNIALLKLYLMGKQPANFLEVMACEGGCVNGPVSLAKI